MRVTGSITAGRMVRLTRASFQSVLTSTNSSAIALKHCRKKSASICEVASCTLSMSFMMDDMSWPVECDFEKLGALAQHLVEDGVAQIRDGGKAGVADQVVAQVVADAFDEEARR